MFSNLGADLRFAIRSARHNPLFTTVVLATLALGIGANTAMYSVLRAALIEPLPYQDPGSLVYAQCTFGGEPNPMASAPDYYDYRDQADSFETLSATGPGAMPATISGRGQAVRADRLQVTGEFFRTLGVPPVAGRWFNNDEGDAAGPEVVIVSERLARRRFGSAPQAVGQVLITNDAPLTIVGVMPASFRFLFDADLWTPIRRGEGIGGAARRFHNLLIVGRLKPGASLETARQQVDLISLRLQRQYPDSNTTKALQVDPLQAGLTGDQRPRLLLLMSAVGLILLIACANVAGLLLARGSARQAEMAVRTALGASRRRIVGQLLVESVSVAGAAGVIGCVLVYWLQRLIPAVTGLEELGIAPRSLDWPVLAFAVVLSCLTGVLFGIVPAVWTSSPRLAARMSSGVRTTGSGLHLQGALVTAQIAITLVLLLGAGLFVKSFVRLSATRLGYTVENVLTGDIALSPVRYREPVQRFQFYNDLGQQALTIPGVRAVGFVSHIPMRNRYGNIRTWAADNAPTDPDARTMSHRRVVLPGYFETMQMRLVAGRDLSATDREGTPNALVINELMARALFPNRQPVGQRVMVDMGLDANQTDGTPFTVVGLVGDARIDAIQQAARPTMYMSYYQFPRGSLRLVMRTELAPESVTQSVRRLVAARDPEVPLDNLVPLTLLVGKSVAVPRVLTTTVTLFAVVAMVLASIGLYGMLSYLVSQRTREIGVRVALGADAAAVMRHVLGRAGFMVVLGLAAGLCGAFATTRLIAEQLYGVTPTDPITFMVATMSLAAVGLGAAAGPAWRAARIDPVQALRKE